MKSYLYAVYDRLANSFGSLVEYHTDGAAIRDFKKMYAPGVTADPSQYELHKIGSVFRVENSSGVSELTVLQRKLDEPSLIYNYTAYVSERLDCNALIDQLAFLSDEDIDRVAGFVKSLKEGDENNGSN